MCIWIRGLHPECQRNYFNSTSKQQQANSWNFSQFRCSFMPDPLPPHELQLARPPCLSPTPGVYSNSCPLSQWCHQTISSSVILSPPSFILSQHQCLFKWVSSLHQVAKVLEYQLQHQSFQWIFRTGWNSMQTKGLSRVFSKTTVQKHQFSSAKLSLQSNSHICKKLQYHFFTELINIHKKSAQHH